MSEVRLIDANALKEKIKSRYDDDDAEFDRGYNIGLGSAVDLIDSAPTLPNPCGNPCNFTRPTGEWINNQNKSGGGINCSICGKILPCTDEYWYETDYCPNCGAKMKKEAENDG